MRVDEALAHVEATFPFPDYLDEDFGEGVASIAEAVQTIAPSGRLLDIGSGPMDVTAVFAQLGYATFAVDDLNDPWHLLGDNRTRIEQFAKQAGITFHRQNGDYSIPWEPASFDVVLIKSVIEHLHESPRSILNTAFTYAKTGGVVVVTMPNSVNLRKRLSVLRGKTNYPPVAGMFHSDGQWRGHVREYTLDETRYIMEQAGGEVMLARTFHSVLTGKIRSPFAQRAYRLITDAAPSLRSAVMVIARKPARWQPIEFQAADYWAAINGAIPAGVNPLAG